MKLSMLSVVVICMFMVGCTTTAPKYQASFENIQKLKKASSTQVNVGMFTPESATVENLTIRGGAFVSPYNGSYVSYLREALRQELYDADRFSDKSNTVVSGVLIKNEIDASGINIGTAAVTARFVVKNGDKARYDKVKSATHKWESSFAGPIAVPRAQQNYMLVFQKLLSDLYDDHDFQTSLK